MRGILCPLVVAIMAIGLVHPIHANQASHDILGKLQQGRVSSLSFGENIFSQMLINKLPNEVLEEVESSPEKLKNLVPGLSFVRAFKGAEDRKFIYVKVKGALDGTGLLFEVRSGFDQFFQTADQLPFEVKSVHSIPAQLGGQNPWQTEIDQAIAARQKQGESLSLRPQRSIVLHGPLNKTLEFNGIIGAIRLEVMGLSGSKQDESGGVVQMNQTYLLQQISFFRTPWEQEWGRFSFLVSGRDLEFARMQIERSANAFRARLGGAQ